MNGDSKAEVREVTLRELIVGNERVSSRVLCKARALASLECDAPSDPPKAEAVSQGIRGELEETRKNLNEALEILKGVYRQLDRSAPTPEVTSR